MLKIVNMKIKLTKKYVLEFTSSWYYEIIDLLKKGHLVAPVRLYQKHHKGATLGEAKKYCEDLQEKIMNKTI